MVVKIRVDKDWKHKYDLGIHLDNPSFNELENAKEDAYNEGFKTIWIHKITKLGKEMNVKKLAYA